MKQTTGLPGTNQSSIFFTIVFVLIFFQFCTKTDTGVVKQTRTDGAVTVVANDTYKISAVSNNAQVLALTAQTADDSALVAAQLYSKDSLSHHWRIIKIASGTYRISCGYSGKVLASRSITAVSGEQLIQVWYSNSKNQKWNIVKNSLGQYRFVNKATGYYMNLEADGKITQRPNSTAQSQLWLLNAVSSIYCDADVNGFFRRTSGWIASDGAPSAQLTDGRVMWMMGDSHINDYNASNKKVFCLFQVRNACLLQPASHTWSWTATSTLTGNPLGGFQSYFKNKADDNFWMWAENGIQPAGNDTLYVYAQGFKKKGTGAFGFANDSFPMFCKVRTSDMKVVEYHYLQDFNDIDFGCGFISESDGYIYAYGARQTFIYANVYVARFPAANPNAPWTFWDGTGWNTDVTKVKRVSEGASNSVNVFKLNGKYVCLSSEFSVTCDAGTHLYTAWSSSLTGTFTTRKIIYQIPDRLQGHTPFFYAPNGHPEFTNSAGELLITYDINGYGDCVNTCSGGYMDPDMYRPKGVRVPQGVILQ